MTEPGLPSSDAKNISTSAVLDGDEWVINGEKFYISGAGDPRCKIMITMVKTSPDAAPSRQQSQILVPTDTPGVEILEGMQVFGQDHAPRGHMHSSSTTCACPRTTSCSARVGLRDFSGPARARPHPPLHALHRQGEKGAGTHGQAGATREAFGKPIIRLGKNLEVVSRARIEINAMRLAVLQAAKAMDVLGNKEARVYVSAVKAMVPEKGLQHHRCGHSDPRRHRHFAVDASGRNVHGHASPEICRRPGRGSSHGCRTRGSPEIRALVSTESAGGAPGSQGQACCTGLAESSPHLVRLAYLLNN